MARPVALFSVRPVVVTVLPVPTSLLTTVPVPLSNRVSPPSAAIVPAVPKVPKPKLVLVSYTLVPVKLTGAGVMLADRLEGWKSEYFEAFAPFMLYPLSVSISVCTSLLLKLVTLPGPARFTMSPPAGAIVGVPVRTAVRLPL